MKLSLLVAGSRDVTDYRIVEAAILQGLVALHVNREDINELISGGARGVDRLAEFWAKKIGIVITQFIPDWSKGRGAGLKRNVDMINAADLVICIWDGASKGTKHSIETAKKKGLPLVVFRTDLKLGDEGQLTSFNHRPYKMF